MGDPTASPPAPARRASLGRRVARGVAAALAVAVLGYLALVAAVAPRGVATAPRLERALDLGARYLVRHTAASGRFDYLVGPGGAPEPGRYNVLRHGGTIYGLGMADEVVPSEATRAAMFRAARYLLHRHVDAVEREPELLAVFSLPGEEAGDTRVAKLGGTALGIVALTEVARLDPDAVPLDTLRGLGRFLLHMQEPDGHFVSKYRERTGYDRGFESLYYPGEAMLALVRLYERDRDPRWLDAALRAADWIATTRADTPWWGSVVDHWYLVAVGAIAPHVDTLSAPPIDRARLLDLARRIGRRILLEQVGTGLLPGIAGAIHAQGRTTPTATRLEGLVALHGLLPADDPLRARVRRAVLDGAAFLLAAQVPTHGGARAGGVPATFRAAPFTPAPGRRAHEVRIDYVQHALSAWAGAWRLLVPAARAGRAPVAAPTAVASRAPDRW